MDLNTASSTQLQRIKGVGPVLAKKLVAARPFLRKEDVRAVSGVGPAKYEAILARITNFKDASRGTMPTDQTNTKRTTTNPTNPRRVAPASENSDTMDLNTASSTQLQRIKGVGPVLAEQIVNARPFASTEELLTVRGIGPAKYAATSARAAIFTSQTAARPARSRMQPGAKSGARFRLKLELERVRDHGATLAMQLSL